MKEELQSIIDDSDIIIALKSANGKLASSRTVICAKDIDCPKSIVKGKRDRYEIILDKPSRKYVHNIKFDSDLKQIGLIQSINFKASVNDSSVDVQIEFPQEIPGMSEPLKRSLKENSSLMAKKGCSVKFKPWTES